MVKCKEAIEILENALFGSDHEVSADEIASVIQTLKDLSEEKDIRRYEIQAQGRIQEVQYINNNREEGKGLIKFIFEKSRKDSRGNWIRGGISCIIQEDQVEVELHDGDRVMIKGDFSPYEVERNGKTVHKIKIWVDTISILNECKTEQYVTHKDRKK